MSNKPSKPEDLLAKERSPDSPNALDKKILDYAKEQAAAKGQSTWPFLGWAPVLATASIAFIAVSLFFQAPRQDALERVVPPLNAVSESIAVNKGADRMAIESDDLAALETAPMQRTAGVFADINSQKRKPSKSSPQSLVSDNVNDHLNNNLKDNLTDSIAEFEFGKRESAGVERKGQNLSSSKSVRYEEGTALMPFRARGHEPSWELSVDKKIILELDDGTQRLECVVPTPSINKKTQETEYLLDNGSDQVILLINKKQCTDSMDDERFDRAVKLIFGDRVLIGCGEFLR